jgi:hypothetical protein
MKTRSAGALAITSLLAASASFASVMPVSVPEPGSTALLAAGLLCVAVASWRRVLAARSTGG